jgi:KDO2-lipid IV(A) lauroyltransferase
MHFIVYIIVYPFLWLISILPFRLLYAFSDFLYLLVFKIFGYRKRVVKSNLNLIFPEKSKEELNRITKAFYHHLCDMIVESIKSMTISESEMRKRFVFTNVEEIHKLEKINKSIVLMCGHYGSWEWIFILQKYVNHKGYAIYKRLANKYFDRLVKRIRAKYNSYLITTKETIPVLIEAKKNEVLTINGFVSDQSPKARKAYHWNDFMGIKVPIHTGAEMIAKKLDMAVVFFSVNKIKRGYYETTFKTLAINPKKYKDYEITDMFIKLVEKQIHEAPEYYLWTHKRWKHKDKVPVELQ